MLLYAFKKIKVFRQMKYELLELLDLSLLIMGCVGAKNESRLKLMSLSKIFRASYANSPLRTQFQ